MDQADRADRTYDVVVIGGGPAGENAADRAVKGGLTAAVVERELVGGECSYWACMPSKALLRPGQALAEARRVPGAREAVSGALDAAAALAWRDEMTSSLDDGGQVGWLEGAGIDLVRGHGRLAGERLVEVTGTDGAVQVLHARKAVVLATGSRAAVPPIEGLDGIPFWDNRGGTQAGAVPRRLAVLGGGVVGVELAQAWRRLGAEEVVLLQRGGRLLPREEPFAGEEVRAGLEADGIDVRLDVTTTRVSRPDPAGPVTLELEGGGAVEADELLVATGRRPATDDLGLGSVGLEPGAPVPVDDHLRVGAVGGGWLFAIGDCNGRVLLTHQGKYQGRIVGDLVAGRLRGIAAERGAFADLDALPRVIFTDPCVGAVGLTEAQARERGLDVRVVTHPTAGTAGGSLHGEDLAGTSQLVVDAAREVVVGATFVGPGAAELVHAAAIAVAGEVPLDRLWHAVPSFPTLSEVWLRLLEAYGL